MTVRDRMAIQELANAERDLCADSPITLREGRAAAYIDAGLNCRRVIGARDRKRSVERVARSSDYTIGDSAEPTRVGELTFPLSNPCTRAAATCAVGCEIDAFKRVGSDLRNVVARIEDEDARLAASVQRDAVAVGGIECLDFGNAGKASEKLVGPDAIGGLLVEDFLATTDDAMPAARRDALRRDVVFVIVRNRAGREPAKDAADAVPERSLTSKECEHSVGDVVYGIGAKFCR